MEAIDISTTALMTVPGVAGIASAFLTALLTRWTTLAPRWRPWLALGVAAVTTAIGVLITYRADMWQVAVVHIAAVAGVAQVVYSMFKPAFKLLNGDVTTVPPVDAEVGPIPADYGAVLDVPGEVAIIDTSNEIAVVDLDELAESEVEHGD